MIGIRADANQTVATGHIMRCISIAKELNNLGQEVIFYTADHDADKLLDTYMPGCRHIVLDSMWNMLEDELPVLSESLQSLEIELLLIDSYQVTYDYLKAISRICRTAYIDDLHESVYPVDVLINYNGYQGIFNYEADYAYMHGFENSTTKLLLGLKYAPLREQFKEVARTNHDSSSLNVLLAAGGGDYLHVMSSVLEQASLHAFFENCTWHVVMGSFVDNASTLEALATRHDNIILHRMVTDMASLMSSCDVGITAAGTMLTECAACSLPSIYYQSADNQRYEADYWSQDGLMIYAGDMAKDRDTTLDNILSSIDELYNNSEKRDSMSEKLSKLVDGLGAARIANELENSI